MSKGTFPPGFRNLIAGADTLIPLVNGTYVTAVNFDNAATTPPFLSVLNEVLAFAPWYSSTHRGKGCKSVISSELYENGREIVKSFVSADEKQDTVIYTKNTTESINLLAHVLHQEKDGRDVILSTWMEHSANDLPWREKFTVDYIQVDGAGRLSMKDFETKLAKYKGRIKLVAATGASNVTGYINPVHRMAELAHAQGAQILVDGAQLVPHLPLDMKPADSPEHIDFLVFSAHKLYAPFGIGVLVGPRASFDKGTPLCTGGGAGSLVTHQRVEWSEPPQKDEAGSPNSIGVVALGAAIKTLMAIGMDTIHQYEEQLLYYTLDRMKGIPGIQLFCHSGKEERRIGIIPFNMEGIPHHLLAGMLSLEAGIAVRNGFFCSHPYCQKLLGLGMEDMEYYYENPEAPRPGMVRASFGLYNNYDEIERMLYALKGIAANKHYYLQKYMSPSFPYRFSSDV